MQNEDVLMQEVTNVAQGGRWGRRGKCRQHLCEVLLSALTGQQQVRHLRNKIKTTNGSFLRVTLFPSLDLY